MIRVIEIPTIVEEILEGVVDGEVDPEALEEFKKLSDGEKLRVFTDALAQNVLDNTTVGVGLNVKELCLFYLRRDGSTAGADLREVTGSIIQYAERITDPDERKSYHHGMLVLAKNFSDIAKNLYDCSNAIVSPTWKPVDDGPAN